MHVGVYNEILTRLYKGDTDFYQNMNLEDNIVCENSKDCKKIIVYDPIYM